MNQKSSYSVDRGARNLLTFAFILFGILCIVFNTEVKRSVLYGIRLSAGSIIPSVFPFFVISDYIYQSSIFEKKGFFSRIYEFIFGLPSCTLPAFLLGNICGFPIGAKCINDLYRDGMISGKDAQRLLIISNNPSVAFTVSAIGAGVFRDLRYGILLYAATLLSFITDFFVSSIIITPLLVFRSDFFQCPTDTENKRNGNNRT